MGLQSYGDTCRLVVLATCVIASAELSTCRTQICRTGAIQELPPFNSIFCYLRTLLACFTKFSMTPSNASLSPNALSRRFSQYSSTSLALVVSNSTFLIWARNSSSVIFDSAASVVPQSILVACKSMSGGKGGPFLFRLVFVVEGWSTDVDDALSFNRTREPGPRSPGGD